MKNPTCAVPASPRRRNVPALEGSLPLAALFALGISLTGCAPRAGSSEQEASSEPPRNVRILELQRSTLDEFLEISGTIRSRNGADLASQEAGVVVSVAADKGSLVGKSAPVIVLDRDLLGAELKAAEADSELASYNEQRTRNLFEAKSVSGQEMLQAATALKKATATAEMARVRYERAVVSAPFAGVVTERYVDAGEYVTPGMPVARILDPYTLVLETGVTETQVGYLTEGLSVQVRLDGAVREASGKISWVGFEAAPGTGKFPVEIRLDNRDLRIRPGVVGRVRIPTRAHEEVLAIPRDAIVPSDRGPTVFLVVDDTARRRDVVLGPDQGLMVVVEEGLEVGDRIIVRGQREVVDGDPVEVREEATASDGGTDSDPMVIRQQRIEGSSTESVEADGGSR